MRERSDHAVRIQYRQAEQDIRYLADGRIGKPFLQHLLFISHHGTHEYRKQRQRHPGILHPGPADHIRACHIEDHPDDRKHAGFGNDSGQDRTGRRRRHRMGRRQPSMHGKHACLCTESYDRQHQHQQRHGVASRIRIHHQKISAFPEHAPRPVGIEIKYSKQRHKCAGYRIEQIFQTRHHRLMAQIMQHQGQRRQCHHLKKQIQRDQISRMVQCDQYPHDDQVKSKIPVFMLLMLHIFK